nr:hypothetical protein [Tanacetum cinerariifolium]
MATEAPQTIEYRGGQLNAALILEDFQDSPDDEEDTRSSQKKGYFARDCFSKTSVPSYQFQPKLLSSSYHKPELRPTKDFEAKYNKVKAKLTLLSSSASVPKPQWLRTKVLMVLVKENNALSKEGARNGEWVKISMKKCDIKKPIWYLDS